MEHTLKDCMRKQWENRPSNIVHNAVSFLFPRKLPPRATASESWSFQSEKVREPKARESMTEAAGDRYLIR